jgi:hypothetical protein
MLVIVQIWDAQNQEVTRRVRATSRRIASKVAEVLHDGKTAKIVPKADATTAPSLEQVIVPVQTHLLDNECPLWVINICSAKGHVRFTPIADSRSALAHVRFGPKADIPLHS